MASMMACRERCKDIQVGIGVGFGLVGDVVMAIQIVEILGRSIQGVTHPFRCRCESDEVRKN